MSQTVVILGGRGMLGTDLDQALQQLGLATQVYDLPDFDLTDADQVRAALAAGEVVVNCAAYTNVDGAETDQERAQQVNGDAVGQLGRLARDAGRRVLHISTDFVFDGRLDRPYVETDPAYPLSVYGHSKLSGEQQLTASGCDHAIVRLQWTYGRHGSNFATKLLERARTQDTLTVVDDQVGSPTPTVEVARVLTQLLSPEAQGLFHCASSGYVSRWEMATFVVETLGLDVAVQPCKTSDFNSPAERPLNSRFNCDKLTGLLGAPLPTWQASLQAYLEQL